jgi:hypothetical protein
LVRLPSDGFRGPAVHAEEVWIKRELLPSGVFRSVNLLPNPHTAIVLRADDRVRNAEPPTPPKPADTPRRRYLASQNYAIPGKAKG